MKRKITTLLLCAFVAGSALAQKPTAVFKKASVDPVIDGVIDPVWADAAPENNIDQSPGDDGLPTLGESGETTWQGLWTYTGLWILLRVTDDAFYPHYSQTPPGDTWKYDKPELYFDVNYDLEDGGGPLPEGTGNGNGHYQITPAFTDGSNDGTKITMDNGVEYAFMVTEPNYLAEYFIPYSLLVDSDGYGVDKTIEIGFDVTIIDRDPGDNDSRNAVWANMDTVGSWTSMDGCGIITLEGATTGISVESVTLTGGGITENNGTLQIEAEVLPLDADNSNLTWTISNGTGRATIDNNGVVKAIMNGDVTITGETTDDTYIMATAVVNITNQIVTLGEINIIKNPYFDDLNADGVTAQFWGGWTDESPPHQIIDGVSIHTPVGAADLWRYAFSQSPLTALPDVDYLFSFVAWADDVRTFFVDFEDIPDNAYNRYGKSSDPRATGGRSEWVFDINPDPSKYVFDVNFDQIKENTIQMLSFQLGTSDIAVYIDSVMLIAPADMAKLTPHTPVSKITVSGDNTVDIGGTLQLAAEVLPAEATYKNVKWSVVAETGEASIDDSGILTPVSAGTVKVIASAIDDSYVSDEYLVTIGWAAGISQNEVNVLRVYPNPAVNALNVVLTVGNSTVTIYNSVGMKVEEILVSGKSHIFDISTYTAGLYFVKSEGAVVKFIK